MDTYSLRVPLGVTAGICPFNFPAMVRELLSPAKPFYNILISDSALDVSFVVGRWKHNGHQAVRESSGCDNDGR